MKKHLLLILLTVICYSGFAQSDTFSVYKKTTVMIPMRDGTKLFTVILSPVNAKHALPFLIQRTPYGADIPVKNDSSFSIVGTSLYSMGKGGYIFILQDMRGKFKSEGIFEMPGGQSGHPLSPFYRAGHEAWVRGEPTPFLPGKTEHTLTLTPQEKR